jgi:hypothetical protein
MHTRKCSKCKHILIVNKRSAIGYVCYQGRCEIKQSTAPIYTRVLFYCVSKTFKIIIGVDFTVNYTRQIKCMPANIFIQLSSIYFDTWVDSGIKLPPHTPKYFSLANILIYSIPLLDCLADMDGCQILFC